MKTFIKPEVRVIKISYTDIICSSSPSNHEHGYKGDGSNGKGWGPNKPHKIFSDTDEEDY